MKGLQITDSLLWANTKSAALGRQLPIVDSSNDLLIFAENCSEQDIMRIINPVSMKAYRLLDMEKAGEAECEFLSDAGLCYRQMH